MIKFIATKLLNPFIFSIIHTIKIIPGFTEDDFPLLASITSWYTCGSGKPRSSKGQTVGVDHQHQVSPSHELDMPVPEEAAISSLPQQDGDAVEQPGNKDR